MLLLRVKNLFLGPVVGLVCTIALLELLLPLLHGRYAIYFRRNIAPATLQTVDVQRFFKSKSFDPDLGWDRNPIARNYIPAKRYIAQSYGDSFVEGAVEPNETWQAHYEKLTGDAILNFGVGGYGLDQAVLKFEKYGRHHPTRIALLGLYHQTFRRALSYHSFYYFNNVDEFRFAFKPMFIKRDGHFELMRPPCSDASCLMQVLTNTNHEVWHRLKRHDYWYQKNLDKPTFGFPNTIKYAQVLQQILHGRRELRGAENYFFVTGGSLDVVEYLVERFVRQSRDMGMVPVCVMLYGSRDLALIKSGIRLESELLKFLQAKNIPYVDTAQYILEQYPDNDQFQGLSIPDGHLNSRGNLMVAEAVAKRLAAPGILGH